MLSASNASFAGKVQYFQRRDFRGFWPRLSPKLMIIMAASATVAISRAAAWSRRPVSASCDGFLRGDCPATATSMASSSIAVAVANSAFARSRVSSSMAGPLPISARDASFGRQVQSKIARRAGRTRSRKSRPAGVPSAGRISICVGRAASPRLRDVCQRYRGAKLFPARLALLLVRFLCPLFRCQTFGHNQVGT